jgi:hypothetical protein
MDKICIIRYEEYILRAYNSKWEAEKYFEHVKQAIQTGNKFMHDPRKISIAKLQLLVIPISQEGDSLDMRLINVHAGGGDPAQYHELGEVM